MTLQSHSWAYIGKNESSNLKRYMHPNVNSSTLYSSQDMETTYVFFNKRMDKEDLIHIFKIKLNYELTNRSFFFIYFY